MSEMDVILRFVERLTVVVIGGLAVYLGYRLFLDVPVQRNQQGEISLPGIKVVLSKVAPGVFFAAFGAIIATVSLSQSLEKEADGKHLRYAAPSAELATAGDARDLLAALTGEPGGAVSQQQRTQVLVAIETLNCLSRLAAAQGDQGLRDSADLALRQAKVTLLRSVWDEEKWGATSELRDFGPSSEANKEVQDAYQAVAASCAL